MIDVFVWKRPADLDVVEVAPDFTAIVRSERLAGTMRRNLASGGTVFAAVEGATLRGYATVVPFEASLGRRWDDLPDALELGAIEVARSSRRRGIGRTLLERLAACARLANRVLIACGVASHWETDRAGLSLVEYRRMLVRLLGGGGFVVQDTDDPEVMEHPMNFLAARIGPGVAARSALGLYERLRLSS